MVHPVTRMALALGLGLLIGGELPAETLYWGILAAGLTLISLPRAGLAGLRGAALALVVGILCAQTVPMGPRLDGMVRIRGVRVGGSVGHTGDVEIAELWRPETGWQRSLGRVQVSFPSDPPPPGVPVLLLGQASPIRRALPGAPDPVRAARLAGVRSFVRAQRAVRLDGEPVPLIAAERDPTGLLRAIVLGDRSGCSAETLLVLRRTGTSHLLSISGFHVGVASAMMFGLVSLATRAAALVWPQGIHSPAPLVAGICAAWAYTALAGWVVPAERAALMLTAALVARHYRRGVTAEATLALIGVALAISEPGAPASASFQLSFGAMVGLVLFVPKLTAALPDNLPWPIRWAADGLATTLGATLGTLPVAAWWFQEVAPLSPVANLVSMPVLGVALVPLGAVVCAAPDPIAAWTAQLATLACEVELVVLGWLAVEPLRPAVGPIGAVLLGLLVLWSLRRPLWAALGGCLLLLAPRNSPSELRLTVLDVGQGDAMLVEYADGRRWLIDGGRRGVDVAQWLRRSGIRSLDVVVATHADADHSHGLVSVLDTIHVSTLWALHPPAELEEVALRRGVTIAEPPTGDDRVLYPASGCEAGLSENDCSVVLGIGPFLLTGDLERRGESLLLSELPHSFPVLKVGHHGSRTSTTPELLDWVSPALAIVSVGPNAYGHPDPTVLSQLVARGIVVLRTDIEGTITLEKRGDELLVRTASGREGTLPLRRGGRRRSLLSAQRIAWSLSERRRRRRSRRQPRRQRSCLETR